MLTYPFEKSELNNFGLDSLSLDEAAEVVAKCLFLNGQIEVPCKKKEFSFFHPELDELLKEPISEFLKILTSAVHEGTLKAENILRELDGSYVTEETYINDETLCDWLSERSIELGEGYEEYFNFKVEIFEKITNLIEAEYIKKQYPHLEKAAEGKDKDEILTRYFELKVLEEKLSQQDNKPLLTRERQSVLKLILGMAIKGYTYNPKQSRNDAIREIAQDLESLGIALDQDTIRKWIKEASENLPQEESDT